jgi:VanZ family protein
LPPSIDRQRLEPHYAWIALAIAAAILYGSFYPFGFYLHHDPRGPVGVLLDSGLRPSTRGDVISNILLYLPFGFFLTYAIAKRTLTSAALATAAGFALSLFVELSQFYFIGRAQELSDVYSNTAGALLGASLAAAARHRLSSPYLALLLTCWIGYRCYPAPPLVRASAFAPMDLLLFFSGWLAVGLMIEALCGESRGRVALPSLLAGSLLVRAFAVDIEPAEIAGGVAAALLWSGLLWRIRVRAAVVAGLFVALVVLLALQPFHFSTPARSFGWVPFRGFLVSPIDNAIRTFFQKAYLYGGMVWLLVRAGWSAAAATAFGAMLVFCLRLLQVYLPGRSAEITDAILLLMLAAMMKLVSLAQPARSAVA